MRRCRRAYAVVFAILGGLSAGSLAVAQELSPEPRPVSFSAAPSEGDGLLTPDELDALVAPVALYPDSLLTQVLVAATYPLEIVKADRFLTANAALEDKARADLAEQQDWDPSIQVLTGGFPTVVQHMATEVDWTEELGDAMLAQTDDLLDAVQRQRARAVALGNLSTNEAQVVEEEDENISIAPADPDLVYVPSYDSSVAFAQPYAAPPVIATADTGYSTGNLITTGAIAFGSALLINEIFEDDDDDWDNYWGGPSHIDWDEGDFDARPGIDIEGDVNIDRDRVNIDRDRTNIDRDRIGAIDPDRPRRTGDWQPSNQSRAEARDRLAARERPEGSRAAAQSKLEARSGVDSGAREKLAAAQATRQPAAAAKANFSAFNQQERLDAGKSKQAVNRGSASKSKVGKATTAKPKSVTRSKASRPPPKKSASRSSAFKPLGSGSRAKASKSRGSKSSGGRGGGGRGGGRGRR